MDADVPKLLLCDERLQPLDFASLASQQEERSLLVSQRLGQANDVVRVLDNADVATIEKESS
jgi:hypothetical protein